MNARVPSIELEPAPLGLLPKLAAGPAALLRSGRRVRRTSVFLAQASAHIRRELSPLPDTAANTRRRQGYMHFMAGNLCALSGFEVRVRGPVPAADASCVLMCNHISWQDPLLIADVLPTVAIAKREVGSWPVVGDIASGLGMLLVERGCAHSGAKVLLRARRTLLDGGSVLTFPEGTTSYGESILPFHRGMFGLAQRLDIPVTPIALRYFHANAGWVGDANFLPHYLETVGRPRTVAELHFGAPMGARAGERAEDFAARVREAMLALYRC